MAKQEGSTNWNDRFPGAREVETSDDMYQWTKVGQELVGTFVKLKEYKNGHIANVETEDGIIAFSAPTLLANKLEAITKGTKVAIVFTGEKPNKNPKLNPTKLFKVFELEE